MALRIGINGLGRIGRCVVRALTEEYEGAGIELVAANGPAPMETHLQLLKYDSVHGRFMGEVAAEGDHLRAGAQRFRITREKDPASIDWAGMGVELVLECSGKFNSREAAAAHLKGGAKRVLISAPAENADATVVYGVNHGVLDESQQVISVGSCTTNCLAPVAQILHRGIGIERGFMTTVHAFTGDQNLVDGSHKDMRRARAATMSMIPTSTGAAKAIGLVLPELSGRLEGVAIRVPVPNVSLVDFTFDAARDTTKEEINSLFEQAAEGYLRGVLGVSREKLVSIDLNHTPLSSVVDAGGTHVVGGRFARVAAWYDNEWAFSCRMLDVAKYWSQSSGARA